MCELLLTSAADVEVYGGCDGVLWERSQPEHADPLIKKNQPFLAPGKICIAHIRWCVCTNMFMHVYVFASMNLSDGFDQFMAANCEIHLSLNMFYLNVAFNYI